jgi:hypothetical protein
MRSPLGGMRAGSIPRVAATGISILLLLLFMTYSLPKLDLFCSTCRSTPLQYPDQTFNLPDSVQNDTLGVR